MSERLRTQLGVRHRCYRNPCVAPAVANDRSENRSNLARFFGECHGLGGRAQRRPMAYTQSDVRLTNLLQANRTLRDEVTSAFGAAGLFQCGGDRRGAVDQLRGYLTRCSSLDVQFLAELDDLTRKFKCSHPDVMTGFQRFIRCTHSPQKSTTRAGVDHVSLRWESCRRTSPVGKNRQPSDERALLNLPIRHFKFYICNRKLPARQLTTAAHRTAAATGLSTNDDLFLRADWRGPARGRRRTPTGSGGMRRRAEWGLRCRRRSRCA